MTETSTRPDILEISPDDLHRLIQDRSPLLIFDLRLKEEFQEGHIEGSAHAVCDARAKETIMPKIPKNVKIVLVDGDGSMSAPTAQMMKSMGFDVHYLKDGIKSWNKGFVKSAQHAAVSADDVWKSLQSGDLFLLDVREPDEFSDFKIPGSVNVPLKDLFDPESVSKIPKNKKIVTICPHGNRAMVATFALIRNGVPAQALMGGLTGWNQLLNPTQVSDHPVIIQVEKVGKGCLSYIAASGGDAVVIDPLYPAEKYQEIAKSRGFTITKIIDTHQHADHVSAARDLAAISGAKFFESGLETWDLEADFLNDGDVVTFGQSKIRVLHTPGHTPGSMSYLLDEKYVFTGDTLFVESVGRPDLRDKAAEFAAHLYGSLHNKLLKLPPHVVVLPAHHGEFVKPQSGVYSTTIEKAKTHHVLSLSKDDFVREIEKITLPRPMNYRKIIDINKGSAPLNRNEIPDLEIGPNRCSIIAT